MVTEQRRIKSISLKTNEIAKSKDELALDEPICIFINDEYHVTLIASPGQIKELAIGYLLGENIIKTLSEVEAIENRENNVYVELVTKVDLREVSVGRMNLIVTACGANPRVSTYKPLTSYSIASH